jgi:hypothetical protein
MEEDYNKRPTNGQLIVIAFAVYGFMRILTDLTGCNATHAIYAGFGNQLNAGPEDWTRTNTGYGTFGYEGDLLIHPRDSVYLNWNIHHKSDPTETDRGEENVELKLKKVFK